MRAAAVGLAVAAAACQGPRAPAATSRVENLHAFARLYGVVRWFHPGDAAAAIDWDRFALEGAGAVLHARNRVELRERLVALFAPVAPTVRIEPADVALTDDPALHPAETAGLDVIAWEHLGYGDSGIVSVYQSKRRHRAVERPAPGLDFAVLMQTIDATPYRGKQARLRARLRVAHGGRGQMWFRIDRAGGAQGFFDNMDARPVTAAAWTPVEITGPVAADATAIVLGVLDQAGGEVFVDEVELAVETAPGTWQPVALADPGFEAADPLAAWKANAGGNAIAGWNVTAAATEPAAGKTALRLAREMVRDDTELFDDAPAPGETVDVDLGAGLHARVPIALYARDGRTLGDDPAAARAAQPEPWSRPGWIDARESAAAVIVAWNVLEHFWPYWQDVTLDWGAALDAALTDALDDRSFADHLDTLRRLAAAAPDGHAWVQCPGAPELVPPPFAVAWAEGKIVVTTSATPDLHRGDILVSVDDRPVDKRLAELEARASGSPQWKRERALAQLGAGTAGMPIDLWVQRGTAEIEVVVPRAVPPPEEPRPGPIERRPDGVYYVDVSRAETDAIRAAVPALAAAPGVVFDLRGYPRGDNKEILSYLLDRPDDSTAWMTVARIIRPDHPGGDRAPTWATFGWELQPLAPHIDPAHVAWLTGPGAISYAESMMSLVDHYHLGTIVGGPTAGTNGNVARIDTPTGCAEIFTGMRVTRHDGSRYHLLGVSPAVPVERTVAGIAAGRDEVLERGVEVARAGGAAVPAAPAAP